MARLKLVSIVHPELVGRVPVAGLGDLDGMAVTLVTSDASEPPALPETAQLLRLPVRGRGLRASYAGLRRALAAIAPDVIHVHGDPASLLAFKLSRSCGGSRQRGFVLDCEPELGRAARLPWAWLRRRTLGRVDALLARDQITLERARAGGLRGPAIVAGRGDLPDALPEPEVVRRRFDVPVAGPVVFGWAGPLGRGSAIDLLEAVAACEHELVMLIPASGALRQEIEDRADALEILGRIRLVEADLGLAPILAAADAVVVTPPIDQVAGCTAAVEMARGHGVPLVYADVKGLTELVGPGGWPVRADDPGLLAGLLDEISRTPACIAEARRDAAAAFIERDSPAVAGAKLASAIWAAHRTRSRDPVRPDARHALGLQHLRGGRQASRT